MVLLHLLRIDTSVPMVHLELDSELLISGGGLLHVPTRGAIEVLRGTLPEASAVGFVPRNDGLILLK